MGAKERQQIQEGIRELARANAFEIYQGQVDSIDTNNLTIDVKINDDLVIPGVRLNVITGSDKGVYILPKKNSHVVIGQMDGGVDFVLIRASEIDKLILKIESRTLEIDKDAHIFDGGHNEGMVKVVELTQKLNNVENKVNELINTLRGVSVALAPSGTYPFAPIFTPIQTLTPTNKNDIKNDKVKH